MTRTDKSVAEKKEVAQDSKEHPRQSLPFASKVQNVERLDKSVIKLLKSQGKYYRQILPKRVQPTCTLKVPPIVDSSSPEKKPKYFIPLQISTASDWGLVDSSK